VSTGHGKDVRGAIDQGRRERLAALSADVRAFFFADLHRVKTWRLAAHGMHAGRKNFDVLTVPEQMAKKPFCDWAATNIAGADKEDAFHGSQGASERRVNLEANWSKSIKAMAVVCAARQAVALCVGLVLSGVFVSISVHSC
jgi:hypothetical protein